MNYIFYHLLCKMFRKENRQAEIIDFRLNKTDTAKKHLKEMIEKVSMRTLPLVFLVWSS